MRKSSLILAALLLTSVVSLRGQGTIQFANSILTRVKVGTLGSPDQLVDAPVGAVVGVFWGEAADNLHLQTPTMTVTSPGLFGGSLVYGLTGTSPGQQVFLKLAGWYNANGPTPAVAENQFSPGITHWGETRVVQVTLGATAGPGTVIMQGATGTNPNRVGPLILYVPEPSVPVLAGIGILALGLFGRRRKAS